MWKSFLRCIFAAFFLVCLEGIFAFSPQDIEAYTLENGLRLYLLTDTGTATVRLELDVYAGYSAQSEKTAGFFPLYARLLAKMLPAFGLEGDNGGLEVETAADCVRMVATVSPLQVEESLSLLSQSLKPLLPSDALLRAELTAMKAEVNDYAASPAGFINTAIDARIFPDEPWKQESGVYPALFSAQTVQSARVTLDAIGNDYYTAPNAALFISGNITREGALLLAGRAFSGARIQQPPLQKPVEPKEADVPGKFLLADDAFSSDMVQIVLQYRHFTRPQADLLASVYNDDRSAFKARLTGEETLGIRGAEYVHVASAQKRGSSRLIIQSLLEKTKASPCQQAERFLSLVEDAASLDDSALTVAAALFRSSFARLQDNAASLMELYASLVAVSGRADREELFSQADALSRFSAAELRTLQRLQSPAVFVLVNTAVYKKYAAAFQKAGYSLVTVKNASWYSQELHKARLQAAGREGLSDDGEGSGDGGLAQARQAAARFIESKESGLSSFTLPNGIPVVVKREPSVGAAALMITISGGELLFADKTPGLAALLTDALALSMRRHIAAPCDITAESYASFSRICIQCDGGDLAACIRGAFYALIYADITPAMADGVAYDERTQWRLKTGTAAFQLACEAVRTVYGNPYARLFNDREDKPTSSMDYTRIASAYPLLLDSSRYSLILAGAVMENEELEKLLTASLGALESKKATASKEQTLPAPKIPKKTKTVKLRHLFLTDVSADKAGPRPQILVPTKDFSDPLLYCLPSPDVASSDSALYQVLLYELAARLQKKVGAASKVQLSPADDDIAFSRLVVTNVTRTKRIDALYGECVAALKQDLALLAGGKDADLSQEAAGLLQRLENHWVLQKLGEAGAVGETARLMQEGWVRAKNPLLYLQQYKAVSQASAQDYYIIAQAYLDEAAPLRLYSADSKK